MSGRGIHTGVNTTRQASVGATLEADYRTQSKTTLLEMLIRM